MRTLLAAGCLLIVAVTALLTARSQEGDAKIRLVLVDPQTNAPRAGVVRIHAKGRDDPLVLTGAYERLRGLPGSKALKGWYVVPAGGVAVSLPRGKVTIEAFSGLETALVKKVLDLSDAKEVRLELPALFRPADLKLVAGNTHLHLRDLTKEDCDEYLRQIPAADGITVMLTSYLERFKDDASYISNRYPAGPLEHLKVAGVLFNNGEEHRHNFKAFGEGYGHVMLLDLKKFVKPASLGPGITGQGFDDTPLRPGIDAARQQGATIIWCHNTNGHEDVPSAITGRLHALNVFDGSRSGSFEENYYRYLNIGLRLPISTGTDWFMYDFSRVYAEVPGELTVKSWLDAVRAGRCQATNGPLLSLKVNGLSLGSTLKLDNPGSVQIEASGLGRHDFQKLELIQNGKVVATEMAKAEGSGYSAKLSKSIKLDGPAWFALRIDAKTENELEKVLYAHTSPVYVNVEGKGVFDLDAANGLLKLVEQGHADIKVKGAFSTPKAQEKLLALYDDAIKDLKDRINRRGQ